MYVRKIGIIEAELKGHIVTGVRTKIGKVEAEKIACRTRACACLLATQPRPLATSQNYPKTNNKNKPS